MVRYLLELYLISLCAQDFSMLRPNILCGITSLSCALMLAGEVFAAEGLEIKIVRPTAYEVVQRRGYVPAEAHLHQPGGAKLGLGKMPIEWELAEGQKFPSGARFEYSVTAAEEQPASPATPTSPTSLTPPSWVPGLPTTFASAMD